MCRTIGEAITKTLQLETHGVKIHWSITGPSMFWVFMNGAIKKCPTGQSVLMARNTFNQYQLSRRWELHVSLSNGE